MYKEALNILKNEKEALCLFKKLYKRKYLRYLIVVLCILLSLLVSMYFLNIRDIAVKIIAGCSLSILTTMMCYSLLDSLINPVEVGYINSILERYKCSDTSSNMSLLKGNNKYYIYDVNKDKIVTFIPIDSSMKDKEYCLVVNRYMRIIHGKLGWYTQYEVTSKSE